MKFENETGRYGYIILSGFELEKWNLKFLMYQDGKIVNFCNTDFYCKKILNYDNAFIILAILRSAWTLKELKREIKNRAPNENMDDEDFWRVHKSYRKELQKIKKHSYYVGETPDDFMDREKRIEVSILEAKLQKELKWLSIWGTESHPGKSGKKAGHKTRQKHIDKADKLRTQISRLEMIYNRPDETDMWADSKTTLDDYVLYDFEL